MKIAGADTPVRDLTRWNRAGLDRFCYVEGAAAEWLEYLRVAHMLLYARDRAGAPSEDPDIWRAGVETGSLPGGLDTGAAVNALNSVWQQPPPQAYVAASADYRTALRAQYDRIPLDQTAQIQRAFVRAFHILTETLNAYANEGFLATATQEPHLRRLLELIDFKPRLPASARVPIALSILPDTPRQTVDRTLSVEYMPTDGSPILTFESFDALIVDPGVNLLRPKGWDQRSDKILADATAFALADAGVLNVALEGTSGLFRQGGDLQAFTVTAASKATASLTLARGLDTYEGTYQETEALLAPSEVHPARRQGATWLHFAQVPACYVGQIVALSLGKSTIGDFTIALSHSGGVGGGGGGGDAFFFDGATEFAAIEANLSYYTGNTATVLELRGRDVRISKTVPANLTAIYPAARTVVPINPDAALASQQVLVLGGYEVPEGAEPVGELVHFTAGRVYIDTGLPAGLNNGSPVVLRFANGTVAGATLAGITKDGTDGFSFTISLPAGYVTGDLIEIAGDFAATSGLTHQTRSSAALFPASMNGALNLDVPALLDSLLKPGRTLLVAPDPETAGPEDAGMGMALTIATATRFGGTLRLTFAEDPSGLAGFTRGHTVIWGNVPVFGHGKSLPEKVLGSGDASLPGQVMTLPASDIATRPDAGFPGGIIPDIEIKVDGRKLRLVSGEDAADPLQPSFVVRLADDGSAEAVFLSRLPTEADNVRLTRFRQGAGAMGNAVPPFAITKPTPRNPIIDTMIQPLSPQFGADLQGAEALKSQGTSYFALLDRALSARDFARLAESTAGIWHAHAGLRREAGSQGQPTVVLTVVPAGGGSVEPIRDDLAAFLTARALPGTTLDIQPFRAAPVTGTATVNLKTGYARDITIAEEIQSVLYDRFNLEARALGRTLFVTELTAAIEAHEAVENLVFTLTPAWIPADPPRVVTSASGAIQAVLPDPTMTVFVAAPEDIVVLWGPEGGA